MKRTGFLGAVAAFFAAPSVPVLPKPPAFVSSGVHTMRFEAPLEDAFDFVPANFVYTTYSLSYRITYDTQLRVWNSSYEALNP